MQNTPLRILITNLQLSGRNGTEIVTRNLALGLRRRGHQPVILTQSDGPIAAELRAASIPVATDIAQIGGPVDVIHAHHVHMAAIAIARFPNAPCVFLAHDFVSWSDAAPMFPSVRRYLSVDETVADRLIFEHGLSAKAVSVHLNAADLDRFHLGPPLPGAPKRALAFAKNDQHLPVIREACAARGIALDVVGQAVGRLIAEPEIWLPRYDVVFASALSALEAMACGRAVVVCDGRGLAGFVTPERFAQWRPYNFGLRTLTARLSVENMLREIDAYDPQSATEVARRVRDEASLETWLTTLVDLYREVIAEQRAAPASEDENALAMARHLQLWAPRVDKRWPWIESREQLMRQLEIVTARLNAQATRAPEGEQFHSADGAAHALPPVDRLFAKVREHNLVGRDDDALAQARRYFSRAPAAYIEENLPEIRAQLWRLFNDQEVQLASRLCRLLLESHEPLRDGSLHYLAGVSTHLTLSEKDERESGFVLTQYALALECGFPPAWPLYHRGRLRLARGDPDGRADLEQARDLGGDAGEEAASFLASLPA